MEDLRASTVMDTLLLNHSPPKSYISDTTRPLETNFLLEEKNSFLEREIKKMIPQSDNSKLRNTRNTSELIKALTLGVAFWRGRIHVAGLIITTRGFSFQLRSGL